jgi:hypothetical protein
MTTFPLKKRIVTAAVTTIVSSSCVLYEYVIAVAAPGTSFTVRIQDKASPPVILVPTFTVAVPTTGLPIYQKFEEPLPMDGGIDIITTGTPGEVGIWMVIGQ